MCSSQPLTDYQMILPGDFFLPFGGKLDEENRWVQLAKLVPWATAEQKYGQFFKDTLRGRQTISLRMGLGALLIQERMQLTDRETLASISENPYSGSRLTTASRDSAGP